MSTIILYRICIVFMSCFVFAVDASKIKCMWLNFKIQSLFYFMPFQDDHINDLLVFIHLFMSVQWTLNIVMTVATVDTFPPFSRKVW